MKDSEHSYILTAGYTTPNSVQRRIRGRLPIPPVVEHQLKTDPQIVPDHLKPKTNGKKSEGYVLVTCRPVSNGSIDAAQTGAERRAVISSATKSPNWDPLGEPVVVAFILKSNNFEVAKRYLRGFNSQNGGTWQEIESIDNLEGVDRLFVDRRIALNGQFLAQTWYQVGKSTKIRDNAVYDPRNCAPDYKFNYTTSLPINVVNSTTEADAIAQLA